MNTMLTKTDLMPYFTDIRIVFDSFAGRQKEFNWLITNIECNYYPDERLNQEILLISGDELSQLVYNNDIQFIWAVLSGFDKSLHIDVENLEVIPYADGNPQFWVDNPSLQHPLATIEIVCFDSSYMMLLSKDDDITFKFRNYFKDSKDLNEENQRCNKQLDFIKNVLIDQINIMHININNEELMKSVYSLRRSLFKNNKRSVNDIDTLHETKKAAKKEINRFR